jgi:hypothetical protein
MSKKVLAVYYTQTGQLGEIMNQFISPLAADTEISVEKLVIQPARPFPFPWSSAEFFDAMPESVLLKTIELAPFTLKESKYDLIIIGFQPWFLSPSLPISSFLQHPSFRAIAKDTPVVTISGCRNMWINAQEKNKKLLQQAGANLAGNIALVDKHNNYVSLVTILYWMFSGKKDKKWGIFPKPGVSDEDIVNSAIFGKIVKESLLKNEWTGLQIKLQEHDAAVVKYPLMFIERKAGKLFLIWANVISKKKNRKRWLVVFKWYLLTALCVAAPIILTVDFFLFKPFLGKRIKKQKQYYSGVALN